MCSIGWLENAVCYSNSVLLLAPYVILSLRTRTVYPWKLTSSSFYLLPQTSEYMQEIAIFHQLLLRIEFSMCFTGGCESPLHNTILTYIPPALFPSTEIFIFFKVPLSGEPIQLTKAVCNPHSLVEHLKL